MKRCAASTGADAAWRVNRATLQKLELQFSRVLAGHMHKELLLGKELVLVPRYVSARFARKLRFFFRKASKSFYFDFCSLLVMF